MTQVRGVTGTIRAVPSRWQLRPSAPGGYDHPAGLPADGWLDASVPGTVASAASGWPAGTRVPELDDVDGHDWWYRCRFDPPGRWPAGARLVLEGLAGWADGWLNGEPVARSENMFTSTVAPVGHLLRAADTGGNTGGNGGNGNFGNGDGGGGNELVLRFRALAPFLAGRHGRPRWRTRLVERQQLRWVRRTLLGRIPAWSPGPPAVGPWRPVRFELASLVRVDAARVTPRLDGPDAVVTARLELAAPAGRRIVEARLRVGDEEAPMAVGGTTAEGTLRLPGADRWYPHTHGGQPRYPVRAVIGLDDGTPAVVDLGSTGFRTASFDGDPADFALRLNDLDVFFRGGCWTPLDPYALTTTPAGYREELYRLRAAGANMVRVSGPMCYESDDFYDCCDELGITVWQDFMFANMDYPTGDDGFRAAVRAEASQILDRLAGHPSVTVLCGNSEVAQQAALLGLRPQSWYSDWFDEELPALCARRSPGSAYWPSSPSGGALPIHPDRGDAHYQGVGAYLRDVEDAQASGVRFASECLALANVPEPEGVAQFLPPGERGSHHPAWKAGSPRDRGAGWDFDDVRDEYLRRLFGVDPLPVRYCDPDRYLELSRVVSGELMGRVFAGWRAGSRAGCRPGQGCRGGLVWFWRDLVPGAGWGVVDSTGRPKAPYHYLRRVWQPVAVTLVDRGLNGIEMVAHNDRPEPVHAVLRLLLFTMGSNRPGRHELAVTLPPHSRTGWAAEQLAGGFRDLNHAYRFGPRSYRLVVAELAAPGDVGPDTTIAEDFYLPAGPPADVQDGVNLTARARRDGADLLVTLSADLLAYAVTVGAPGYLPDDAYFHLAPGRARQLRLRGGPGSEPDHGWVRALNAGVGSFVLEG